MTTAGSGSFEERVRVLESPTARGRGDAVSWHLGAASRFAKECADLQAKPPDPSDAHTHYCLAAVVLSAGALEAYANELLWTNTRDGIESEARKARINKLADEPSDKLAGKRGEVLAKFVVALDERESGSNENAPEYRAPAILIKTRNALAHFKPEYMDAKVEHAPIAKLLREQNVAPYPLVSPADAVFPEHYMQAGLAQWAFGVARDFVEWAATAAGDERTVRLARFLAPRLQSCR